MQGRPELAGLPRFRSASRRTINRKTLQMQGRRPKSLPKFRPAVRQNGTSGDSWLKRKAAPPSHLRIARLLGPLPGGPARLQNLKTRGRPTFESLPASSARPPATGERTTLKMQGRNHFLRVFRLVGPLSGGPDNRKAGKLQSPHKSKHRSDVRGPSL